MSDVGVLDRLMRRSVDRALHMQPKRVRDAADEVRFSAPTAREEVASVRAAAARLVEAGLALPTAGRIALRRTDRVAAVTVPGADLSASSGVAMTTVHLDTEEPDTLLLSPIRAGARAAVLGQPVKLLALAVSGERPADLPVLVSIAGPISFGSVPDGFGVGVDAAWGAIAVGADPVEAVARLEAAERLAAVTIDRMENE
jgi:hypothetical protein